MSGHRCWPGEWQHGLTGTDPETAPHPDEVEVDLSECEESIYRGDPCLACGAEWHAEVEHELHHRDGCSFAAALLDGEPVG